MPAAPRADDKTVSGAPARRSRRVPARVGVLAGVGAVLFLLTNGPIFLFAKHVLDRVGHWEDPAVWIPFGAAAAASVALFVLSPRSGHRASPEAVSRLAVWAVGCYTALAVVSTLWSVDRDVTLWRSTVYVGLALLAVVVARLKPDDLNVVVAVLVAVALAGSVATIELRPWVGLDDNGDWRGIFTNRNSLAPIAALGVIAGLRGLFSGRATARIVALRAGGTVLAVASVATMFKAGSRTAWLALAVALGVACGGMLLRWWHQHRPDASRRAAAAGALGGVAAVVFVLAAVWDTPTLAQRRTMWSLVWDRIVERPLGGYGFFAFWDVGELTAPHELLQRGSAHNSLLETGLGLGLVGVAPFVVIVALAARNAAVGLWRHPSASSWWWAATVAFLLVENVTESFVLWFSYNWVLLMAAALRLPSPGRSSVTVPKLMERLLVPTSSGPPTVRDVQAPGAGCSQTSEAKTADSEVSNRVSVSATPCEPEAPSASSHAAPGQPGEPTQPPDPTGVAPLAGVRVRAGRRRTVLGRLPGWLWSGWTVVTVVCVAVLAIWLVDLNLPLGNSDDGRILGRFGLSARNFWELGALDSRFGAVMEPFLQSQFEVAFRQTPPIAAVTYAHHPPLQVLLSVGSVGVLGDSPAALRVTGFALGAATVAFMAALLRAQRMAWGPTLLAVCAMACTGFFYVYARIGVGFSLLVASLAAAAWLRTHLRPPSWALGGFAALTCLTAMQSWIAMAAMAPICVWLLTSPAANSPRAAGGSGAPVGSDTRQPATADLRNHLGKQPPGTRQDHAATPEVPQSVQSPSRRGPGRTGWLARQWSPAVTAAVVGTGIGMLVTAVWILNATDISELVERVAFRTGTDVDTVSQTVQFSFGEFLSRQWRFAGEELLAPVWLRWLLVPALLAGLVDRRTRVPVAITLGVAAVLTFGFQQGAWIHRLWNFPWLAPATIGLAALGDAVRRVTGQRLRLVATAAAVTVVVVTMWLVVSGSTRQRYLVEPADAGAVLEAGRHLDEAKAAELVWVTRHTPTPRWVSYYLDLPAHTLEAELLDGVQPTDLVVIRVDRIPEWLTPDVADNPLAAKGNYALVTGDNLPRGTPSTAPLAS